MQENMPEFEAGEDKAKIFDFLSAKEPVDQAMEIMAEEHMLFVARKVSRENPKLRPIVAYMLASGLPYEEINHLFPGLDDGSIYPEQVQNDLSAQVTNLHRRESSDDIG